MPEVNQAWLALIGALLGGSGLKVIEYWLNRTKTKDDTATQFRNELRGEVKNLREEVYRINEAKDKVEAEVDQWRMKYYELMDEYMKFKQGSDPAA